MKKILRILPVVLISNFICILSHSQLCLTYEVWTATKNGSCSVNLHWKYQQCETGKFYVQYSKDGVSSHFYTIAVISSTGSGNGEEEDYYYTDNSACPGDGGHHAFYRIDYVRDNTGTQEVTSVQDVDLISCSCGSNNSTRCTGLPSISISGSNTICTNSS